MPSLYLSRLSVDERRDLETKLWKSYTTGCASSIKLPRISSLCRGSRHLIRTPAKGEFEKQLKEQKDKFIKSLKNEEAAAIDGSLSSILLRSRKELIDYIFTNIREIKESWPYLFKHNKILYREFQKAETDRGKDEILKKVVEYFVQEELHFPDIDDLIGAIDIKCDYYDVSDELLRDEEFSNILNNQGLHDEIRDYGAGYKQQSKQQSLFGEKD